MKVIFLDIDGVLNSNDWAVRRFKEVEMDEIAAQYPFYEFDPKLVENLNSIIEQTGAVVVVSSTWRHGRTKEDLQSILDRVGFRGEIIDVTPHFGSPKNFGYTIPRGCEIEWWLKQKKFQRINWSREEQRKMEEKAEVKNYVILDDDSDMLYGQSEHFVKCSFMNGLTQNEVDKSVKILNSTLEELYYND